MNTATTLYRVRYIVKGDARFRIVYYTLPEWDENTVRARIAQQSGAPAEKINITDFTVAN